MRIFWKFFIIVGFYLNSLLIFNLFADDELSAEGYNTIRIENEFKLFVPLDKIDEIWTYLTMRYLNLEQFFLKQYDVNFRTEFSTEYFTDTYYDNSTRDMLKNENGLRRRLRIMPESPEHKKNGRILIQLKLKRNKDLVTNRSEIKFPVDKKYRGNVSKNISLWTLIKSDKYRKEFVERLKDLKIDYRTVRPMFDLHQERKRIYVYLGDDPFATITLDTITVQKWWKTVRFSEIEMELNEIKYSNADIVKRSNMQKVNNIIKNDLTDKFPYIKQDQLPKYNKAYNILEKEIPMFSFLLWLTG